jgi:hypothetical protein
MFKKLFGSSSSSQPVKQQAPQSDPMETMNKLSEQIENVQKRSKKIEMDMKRLVEEALQKKKQKDTRGTLAYPWISLMKLYRCHFCFEEKEDARKGSCQA